MLKNDSRENVQLPAKFKDQCLAFVEMLEEFESLRDGGLWRNNVAKDQITILNADDRPAHSAPFRAEPAARKFSNAEIGRMITTNLNDSPTTKWAVPIVLPPRRTVHFDFCVEYRKLNAVTIRDSYTLPPMDECINNLGGATVFSTLDANSGYCQINIDKHDRDKTVFTSNLGQYRFTRMRLELEMAPAMFQRAIDVMLASIRWHLPLV